MTDTKISAILTVEGLRKFQSDMDTAADSVDKTADRGNKAGAALSRAAKVGFLAAGAAAIVSVKKFASFDDALNRVQINSGASAKEMVKLEKVARKMGEKFPASAVEVADAMNEILKAGMSVEDMLSGGLENALAMATAEGMEMASAANVMSNAMNTFGVSGENANQVAAALSNVASKTSADVNDLALSLGQVGGTADNAGWSIAETTAALGVLIQRGLTGSKAGTSLNNMLLRMMSAGGEAKKAMKALGIEVYDSRGKMKSAEAVLDELADTMKNSMTDAERNGLLMKAFGIDGLDAARNLGKARNEVRQLTIEAQKVDAPVQKARDQMKSLGMQLDTTGEALGNMAMQVGGALAPAVAASLPHIQGMAQAIGDGAEGFVQGAADAAKFGSSVVSALASAASSGSGMAAAAASAMQLSNALSGMPFAQMAGGAAMGAASMALIVAGASAARTAVLTLTAAIMANPAIAIAVIGAAAAGAAIAGIKSELKDAAADADSAAAAVRGLDAAIEALSPEGAKKHGEALFDAKVAANDYKLAIENLSRVNQSETATAAQVEQATLSVQRAFKRKTEAADAARDSTERQAKAVDNVVASYKRGGPAVDRASASIDAQATAVKMLTLGILDIPDSKETDVTTTAKGAQKYVDILFGTIRGGPSEKITKFTADTAGFSNAMASIRSMINSIPSSKTVTVRTRQTKAEGGPVVAMAAGGRVNGAGTGTSDSVPAMLSAGEWVLTKKQAEGIGYGTLASLPKFAQGGAWFTSQANAMRNATGTGGAYWKQMQLAGRSAGLEDDRASLAAQAAAIQARLNAVRNESAAGKGDTLKANTAARAAAITELQSMLKDTNASIWQIDKIGMPAAEAAEQERIAGLKADEGAQLAQAAAAGAAAARTAAVQAVGSSVWEQSQRAGATASLDDDVAVLHERLAKLRALNVPEAAEEIAAADRELWTLLNITIPAQQAAAVQDAINAVGSKGSDLWKRSSLAAATETLDDDLAVLQERLTTLQSFGPAAAAQIADTEADIWTMLNITMPAEAAQAKAQQDAWRNEAAMALGRGFYSASGGAGGGGNMGTTDTSGGDASGVGHAPRPEIDRVWLAGEQLNDLDARTSAGVTITEILGWDEAEDFESTRSKRADGDALGGTRDGGVKLVVRGRLTGTTYQDYHERRRALKAKVRAAVDQTTLKVPDVTYGDEAGDYPSTYAAAMAGMERRIVRLTSNLKFGDSFGLYGSEFEFELRSPHRYVEADVAAEAPSGTNAAAMTASAAARTSVLAIRGEIAAAPAMDSALKFYGTSVESVLSVRAGASGAALDTFTKLTDPATLPAGTGNGVVIDPTDTYAAIAHGTSPYVTIYKRSGDTFTKLADPADLPGGVGQASAFDPTSTYLAIAHTAGDYVTIYKRSGDTFTKLTAPAILPTGNAQSVSFDSTGAYLAVAHGTSPYVTIYKRSGDTFTKLADPATLPAGAGNGSAFDPTSTYLAIAHTTSPYVTIYKRSGDTFTKLTNPTDLPTGTGAGAAFDPTGTYLAVAHSTSPYVTIYKRSGDTFSKVANPSTLPTGTGQWAAFDPSGAYLAVAHSTTPYLTIYGRDADTFTKLTDPATLPAGTGGAAAFSASGAYLAVAHATTPYVTTYAASGSNAAFDALGTISISPPALAVSGKTYLLPVASADISSSQPLTSQDSFEIDTIAGTATPVHRTPLARLIGGSSFVGGMIPARISSGSPTVIGRYITRSAGAADALAALTSVLSHTDVINEAVSGNETYSGVLGALTADPAQVATGMPGYRAKRSGANFTASSYWYKTINTALGEPKSRPVIHTMLAKPAASWATATTDLNAFGAGVTKFAHLLTLTTVAGSTNHVHAVGFYHNGTRLVPTCVRYDDKATDGYRFTYANAALSITPDPASHVWVCALLDAGVNFWTAIILVDVNTGEPLMWFVEGHDLFDGGATETTGTDVSQTATTTTSGTIASNVAYPTGATRQIGCGTAASWAASVAGTTVPAGGMGAIITLDAAAELFDHGITSAATLTDASDATAYSAISASIVEWVRARFAPQSIRRAPIALETNWTDRVPDLHGEPVVRIDSIVNSDTLQDLGLSRTGGLSTEQMVTAAAGGAGETVIEAREVR